MESNSIVAAPQIAGSDELIEAWLGSRFGRYKSANEFYPFMITPSPERDEFLASRRSEAQFCGQTLVTTYH